MRVCCIVDPPKRLSATQSSPSLVNPWTDEPTCFLYGDLVEAVVYYEDLDASFPGDAIRDRPTPDYRPGTSGLPRVAQRGRSVARGAARPSMRSMLSTLTRSTKSSRHSSSDPNHGLSPLSTSRTLPQLPTKDPSDSSLTWSTSAPRIPPPSPHNEDRV